MDKEAQAKERLARLAAGLLDQIEEAERERMEREQRRPELASEIGLPQGCWIAQEDAQWLARAINEFLTDAKPLPAALGLTAPRGRKRDPKNGLICEVWAENPDAALSEIAETVYERHPDIFGDQRPPDERQVQRALGRAGALSRDAIEAMSERMQARLEVREQGHK